MRIPTTDKFLLKLYELVEKADDAYYSLTPRSMSDVIHPDMGRMRREYEKENAKRGFKQFIEYLGEQGYIKMKSLEAVEGIILTPRGSKKALKARRRLKEKKKRKDGMWIMVIFDIPENKKILREIFRTALVEMGYKQLQKSVLVCPYDVYEDTEEFIKVHKIIPCVKMFLIKELT